MSHPTFIYSLFSLILAPFIRRVRISEPVLENLRQALEKGQVIFVAQTASIIDFLIISEIMKRHDLPKLSFTHGIPSFFYRPLSESFSICFRRMFRSIDKRATWERDEVRTAGQSGGNGLIFLKNRWGFLNRRTYYYKGFFEDLFLNTTEGQTRLLVPTSVFLTPRRKSMTRSGWDILFGTYDIPSRSRKFWQLITHLRRGLVVFSKPVDLIEQANQQEGTDHEKIEKRLRWALLIHLNNEDRAFRGPTKRPIRQKVRLILKDRVLKKELELIAERQNRTLESVFKEAEKTLAQITSDTNERVMFILKTIFDFVWNRTLDGVDYDPKELAMIRELSTKGPMILCPSHRSHVDYLVLSHTFVANGLNPPRFAAGDNLSRWPLGPILRRAGAFFIRRSFKGEAIFPVVFEAYIRQALRDRQPITFFMEGGRSRTGKLLNPKMGMMGMVLNSWSNGLAERLPIIPITIDYGKVFEGQAYLVEKGGGKKKKEGIMTLLSTPKFLKRKHGVVRIRISKPLYFEEELARQDLSVDTLTFRNKLPFLMTLSQKIMTQINSRVTLTAGNLVAGILLANPRRGMTYEHLKSVFILSLRFLRSKGVEMAFQDKNNERELKHAIETFKEWGTVFPVKMGQSMIIKVPVDERSEMEYYKNNGIHFFVDLALFASAFMITPRSDRRLETIAELAEDIYNMFKAEFLLPENYFESINFEALLGVFLRNGGLVIDDDGSLARGASDVGYKTLQISSHILLNFIESYFCVLDTLLMMEPAQETAEKELLKQILNRSNLLFSVGSILLPESRNNANFTNAVEMLRKEKLIAAKNIPNQKSRMLSTNPKKIEPLQAMHQKLYEWMDELQ